MCTRVAHCLISLNVIFVLNASVKDISIEMFRKHLYLFLITIYHTEENFQLICCLHSNIREIVNYESLPYYPDIKVDYLGSNTMRFIEPNITKKKQSIFYHLLITPQYQIL